MVNRGVPSAVPGRRSPGGGIYSQMTGQRNTPQPKGENYYKHDLWEIIQNEQRKPKWQSIGTFQGTDRIDPRSVDPELMQRLGLKTEDVADYETGPIGEGGVSEKIRGGTFLDQDSAIKLGNYAVNHEMNRPVSKHFGKDWRSISEHDKYKVLDPKAVVWDDTLGWITHKKNYNPDGDKSWFQKNAGSILPAAMAMILGGPAGMAIGLGTSAVNAAAGKTSWQSLLPTLLSAGLNIGGVSGALTNALGRFGGGLANSAIRFGTNQAISRLTNRGGR